MDRWKSHRELDFPRFHMALGRYDNGNDSHIKMETTLICTKVSTWRDKKGSFILSYIKIRALFHELLGDSWLNLASADQCAT